MNDLPNCLSRCKSILFADDTTVYISGNERANLFTDMKLDLHDLITWFQANKLSLNISKTNYILFRPNKQIKMKDHEDTNEYKLEFGTESLAQKKDCKFLGIIIDETLSWAPHCKSVCSKLSSAIYVLRAVRNFIPEYTLKILYYSLFYSKLTYGILLWGPSASKKNIKKNTNSAEEGNTLCKKCEL